MAHGLKVRQKLQGKLSIYTILEQRHPCIWIAINATTTEKVTIKQASDYRLENELRVLQTLNGNSCIRPLVDTVEEPSSLVLRHLNDDLLDASNAKRLEKADLKYVARNIKLNNILVNYDRDSARFSEVQLRDCENTTSRRCSIFVEKLRQISDLLRRRSENADVDSKEYSILIFIKQVSIFESMPLSFEDIADDERLKILTKTIYHINDNNLNKFFHFSADKELSKEDRTFICKIMKLDPRDRPTAKELLQDEWFRED